MKFPFLFLQYKCKEAFHDIQKAKENKYVLTQHTIRAQVAANSRVRVQKDSEKRIRIKNLGDICAPRA